MNTTPMPRFRLYLLFAAVVVGALFLSPFVPSWGA